MSLILLVLLVLLVFALVGGGVAYSGVGYWSFGPLALILVVLLVLWALGALRP